PDSKVERMILEARGVTFRYPRAVEDAVFSVDLRIVAGELVSIVGPNGSGKTTLTRLMLGVLPPLAGVVSVAGTPVTAWTRRALARTIGVVVQREEPAFPLRVR